MSGGVDLRAHWRVVYETKAPEAVSWFEETSDRSAAWIARASAGLSAPVRVLDVGAGASRLADLLIDGGRVDLAAVDVAANAFDHTRARLGALADRIRFVEADATAPLGAMPDGWAQVWHDRAVLHFVADEGALEGYAANLARILAPGGAVVLAGFAPDGPERCSGLPVVRRDGAAFVEAVSRAGRRFELVEEERADHVTPWGAVQRFAWCLLRG